MDYALSTNFITSIIRNLGVKHQFEEQDKAIFMVYIEMEIKMLIEAAKKFMRNDRRTQITADDVEMASKQLNHDEFLPFSPPPATKMGKKKLYLSQIVDYFGFNLGGRVQGSTMRGGYVYHKGKLNKEVAREKVVILREKDVNGAIIERQQFAKGEYNLLLFNELETLSFEERHYIHQIQMILSQNKAHKIPAVGGNFQKTFPVLINMAKNYPNEASLKLIFAIIHFPKVTDLFLSLNLSNILKVLLTYRGLWSYQVGKLIGILIMKFIEQYPHLRNVMDKIGKDFNHFLKMIGFEEITTLSIITADLSSFFPDLMKQVSEHNQMACLCLYTLLKKSEEIESLRVQSVLIPFWIPNNSLIDDEYLMM